MKNRLLNGEIIEFKNPAGDWVILEHSKTLGGSIEFKIELNGKIIKMCKTFKAFENKLKNLIKERELNEVL